jgi:hypothetical protein
MSPRVVYRPGMIGIPASTVRFWVAIVLAFLGGFAAVLLPVVGTDFAYLPGDLVDGRFNNYVLEHGYHYLTGRETSFWNAKFCYPSPGILASSDAHIGNLPVYAIARGVGASPERAFQIWWLTTFALTDVCTIWAMRRLNFSRISSIAVGLAFTFSLPLLASVNHAQLCPRYFLPLALACWWQFLRQPRWTVLAGTLACCAAQAYLSIYLAFFLGLLLAAMFVVAGCIRHTIDWTALFRANRREWRSRMFVVAGTVLALFPYVRAYALKTGSPVAPEAEVVLSLLPKPADWLRVSNTAASWAVWKSWFPDDANPQVINLHLFPGGTALLGLLTGLFCLRGLRRPTSEHQRLAIVLLGTTAILGLVFLKTDVGSVYSQMVGWPVFNKVRALYRIAIVLVLPMTLLTGIALDAIEQRRKRRWQGYGFFVLVCTVILAEVRTFGTSRDEVFPSRYSIPVAVQRRDDFVKIIRDNPNTKIVHVFAPETGDDFQTLCLQLDAMWAAQTSGVATTNGWTGYWPRDWFLFRDYSSLFHWLRIRNLLVPDVLGGLLLIGNAQGVPTTDNERQLRQSHPSVALP